MYLLLILETLIINWYSNTNNLYYSQFTLCILFLFRSLLLTFLLWFDIKLFYDYLILPRSNFHTFDLWCLIFPKELWYTRGLLSGIHNESDLLNLLVGKGIYPVLTLFVKKHVRIDASGHEKILKVSNRLFESQSPVKFRSGRHCNLDEMSIGWIIASKVGIYLVFIKFAHLCLCPKYVLFRCGPLGCFRNK